MVRTNIEDSDKVSSYWCLNCGTLLIRDNDVDKWFSPRLDHESGDEVK